MKLVYTLGNENIHQFYTGLKYSFSLDSMLPAKSHIYRRMAIMTMGNYQWQWSQENKMPG